MREDDTAAGTRVRGRNKINMPMLAQAAYYLITGMWPVLHFRSFEALTGPKPDRFTTESTGMLFVASGVALTVAATEGAPDRSSRALSAAVPLAAGLVTLRHRPQLRAVFLADAATQSVLALLSASASRNPHRWDAKATGVTRPVRC